jgi:hypothetical protein
MDLRARMSQKGVAIELDLSSWWVTGLMVFMVVDVLRMAAMGGDKVGQSYFFFRDFGQESTANL